MNKVIDSKTWEEKFTLCGFNMEDKKIIIDYVPDFERCVNIVKIGTHAAKMIMENGMSYYVSRYMRGENEGHICCIQTTEKNSAERTRLYPSK